MEPSPEATGPLLAVESTTYSLDDESKRCVNTPMLNLRSVPDAVAGKLTTAASDLAPSFDELRMEDIAAASGVPRATLYDYFAGNDDVLAFLLRTMLDDLRASVGTALEEEGDTRARLTAVVKAQLAHRNPAALQLLLLNLGRAGRAEQIASAVDDGFLVPVRRVLGDGVAAGDIDDSGSANAEWS
jgi:TetR/AcrR family transcriptional regulator